jgi:hypothetical protein
MAKVQWMAKCSIWVIGPLMLLSCTTSPEQFANANKAISEANNDPKIAAAIRDWDGPDRRFGISSIQKLRAGVDSSADVEQIMGSPTKIVYSGEVEIWNYKQRFKGMSIWGNAIIPRLFEPSRDYTIRASMIIRQGRLSEYWWSTDVFQLNVWNSVVGLKFNENACRRLENGASIDDALDLIGEPSGRKWFSDGRQELSYLYAYDGKSIVATLRFSAGKLHSKEIITYP